MKEKTSNLVYYETPLLEQIAKQKDLINKIKEQLSVCLDIAYLEESSYINIVPIECVLDLIKEYEDGTRTTNI